MNMITSEYSTMRWIQPQNYLDSLCQEMVTYVTKVNISLEFAEISVPDHDSASCLDAYRIHACAFRYLVRCACYDRRTCDHRGERFGQKNTLPLVQGLLVMVLLLPISGQVLSRLCADCELPTAVPGSGSFSQPVKELSKHRVTSRRVWLSNRQNLT